MKNKLFIGFLLLFSLFVPFNNKKHITVNALSVGDVGYTFYTDGNFLNPSEEPTGKTYGFEIINEKYEVKLVYCSLNSGDIVIPEIVDANYKPYNIVSIAANTLSNKNFNSISFESYKPLFLEENALDSINNYEIRVHYFHVDDYRFASTWGEYADNIVNLPITIKDIVSTNVAFPERDLNRWVNEDNDMVRISFDNLSFEEKNDGDINIDLNKVVQKIPNTDNFYLEYNEYNIKFLMENSLLNAIEVENGNLAGKYEARPSIYFLVDNIYKIDSASKPVHGFALRLNEGSTLQILAPEWRKTSKILNFRIRFLNSSDDECNDGNASQNLIVNSCSTYEYFEYSFDGTNFIKVDNYNDYYEDDDCDAFRIEDLNSDIYIRPVFSSTHSLGDSFECVDPSCTHCGHNAYYSCANCDLYFTDNALTNVIGNTTQLGYWLNDVNKGNIAPLGHTISVDYTWNEDYSECVGTATCSKGDYTESLQATITIEDGYAVATFSDSKFETQRILLPVDKLSGGEIVGIVVGSVAGASLITYIALFFAWKNKKLSIKFLEKSFTWLSKILFKN